MKLTMKMVENDKIVITCRNKEYTVDSATAFAMSISIPRYADMIMKEMMPVYVAFGIDDARKMLDSLQARALETVPKAFAAAKEALEAKGGDMDDKMKYGTMLINITYDCVRDAMEQDHAESNAPTTSKEDMN